MGWVGIKGDYSKSISGQLEMKKQEVFETLIETGKESCQTRRGGIWGVAKTSKKRQPPTFASRLIDIKVTDFIIYSVW